MNAPFAWLSDRRAKATRTFGMLGVPNKRFEHWKYTDARSAIDAQSVEQAGPLEWSVSGLPVSAELFDLSSESNPPQWVHENLASQLLASEFGTASLAFSVAGVALRIPKNETGEIRLDFKSPGQGLCLIVLEENASLTLLETVQYESGFQNVGSEFILAEGARLDHIRIAPANSEAVQVESITVSLGRKATYRAHLANFGAKLSRADLYVRLEGEGSRVELSGVGVLQDRHVDVTTHVDHKVENTKSVQLFKYVAGGHSRGVYQGKVSVAPNANGSDSRQTAKGLLLGNRAEIDLKPELEILADDVKCAHGAAVGDLDAESLFYLRSRGIPEAEARALLMRAFIGDAVDQIEDETIRAAIWQSVDTALEGLS
jgi:Fe-S cluster assembly protein SufD